MQLTYFINTAYAGKMGDASKLAGLGLGTAFIWSVSFYVIMGMNGAMETLVSHAFGAKKLHLCGQYLNRAWVINTVILVPAFVFLGFSKPLLRAFGQED